MTQLPNHNEENGWQEILTPEGKVVREVLLPSPSGEIHRIATISDVRYDPVTGRPECINQQIAPTGTDGTPLTVENFSICQECMRPSAKQLCVLDPLCGRNLCLTCSQLIEWEGGVILRVCAMCSRKLKWQRRWQAIKDFLLGRRQC